MKKVTLLCCLFLGTTGLSQIHAADETSSLIASSSDTSEYCIGSERDVKLFHRIQQYRKVRPHNYGLVSEDIESAKSLRIMGQQEFDNLVSSQDNKESLNHKLKKKGYVKINGTYIAVRGIEKENQPRVPSTFWSKLRTKLPDQSTYALVDTDQAFITREDLHEWALSGYDTQFSKSTWTPDTDTPSLVVPAHLQKEMDTVRLKAETEVKFRNEFVTHTNQFSPAVGATLMHELGGKYNAVVKTITGKALEEQYNLVHQVGKGSSEYPPNVTVLHWKPHGIEAKIKILLGGKGVCFDTGGYNLKPDAADMYMDKGGALSQMALAELIMAQNLPIELTLANGWVVNAISGEA
ncbi:MAG: leucyl aminopeptidase family protein, partial [Alphaproteobacteria bacterium]|nr:leucyl aminopeptidase family protein [Alphaproteobacteria bacterium]